MKFIAHTQEELKKFNLKLNSTYAIEYLNKDYYNGEETIEKGKGVAFMSADNIYFNVTDPYGMDKMVMNVRVLV